MENSAGAVIARKEGSETVYLLLHYDAGHWDFPKGHIEGGESELEAATREIMEETGITDLEFVQGFREHIDYSYRHKRELKRKRVAFFLALTNEKEVRLSFEHQGFEWLTYAKAMERVTFDNSKKVLEKACSFMGKR